MPFFLAFAFLSAFVDVFVANRLQSSSPLAVAAVSFTIVIMVAILVCHFTDGIGKARAAWRDHRRTYVYLNFSSVVTWLALLFALRYSEPAIANVISIASTPAATLLITRIRGGKRLREELITATLMSIGVAALMWISLGGRSGLGQQETELQFLGCILAVVSGIGQAVTVALSSELAQDKVPAPVTVLLRFPLLALIGWGAMSIDGNLQSLQAAIVPGTVMGVLGIALPVFLVQYGLRRVPAYRATAIMSFAPILTVGMQLFDGRITLSPLSLLGVLFITIIALVASRPHRQEANHV